MRITHHKFARFSLKKKKKGTPRSSPRVRVHDTLGYIDSRLLAARSSPTDTVGRRRRINRSVFYQFSFINIPASHLHVRLTSSCFAERANTPPRPSVHRANCHLPPETRGDRIPVTLQRLWSDSQSDPCGCHRPVAKDVVEEVRRREAPARATCRRGAPRDTVGVVPPAGFLGSSRLSPCPPARPGPRPRRRRAFRTLCHPITRPPRRDELRALSL